MMLSLSEYHSKNRKMLNHCSNGQQQLRINLTCNSSEVKSAVDIELHDELPSLHENSMSPSVSTVTVSCTCNMSMSISWLVSRLDDVPDVDGTWFMFNSLCDIDCSNLETHRMVVRKTQLCHLDCGIYFSRCCNEWCMGVWSGTPALNAKQFISNGKIYQISRRD